MTQRIPENFSTVDWSLVTNMGNTIPPRDPATPNRMTSASRRSSENPTKTNKATLAQHGGRADMARRARRRARRFSHSMTSSSTQCTVESKCVSFTKTKKTAVIDRRSFCCDALDFALAV